MILYHRNTLRTAKPYGFGRRITDEIDLLEQQLANGYRVKFGQRVDLYSPEHFAKLLELGRIKYLSAIEKKLISTELKRLRASVGKFFKEVRITSPKRLLALSKAKTKKAS
jgi:hypothetical protein